MADIRRWTLLVGAALLALLGAVPTLEADHRGLAAGAVATVATVAAVLAAGVVARAGRRTSAPRRGWRLVSLAVVVGAVTSLLVELVPQAGGPVDPARAAASVPAHLLGVVGLVSVLGWSRLRAGGARLAVENALFCTAAFVLVQLFVVGPALHGAVLSPTSRVALETSCLAATLLLGSGLTLVSAVEAPRRPAAALSLAALSALAVADTVAALAPGTPSPAGRAMLVAGLVLLCLAALHDPGRTTGDRPAGTGEGRLLAGITLAGQLLPHGAMVLAAVAVLGSALLGRTPTPAALVAVALGLLLTAVHRAVVVGDEMRYARRLGRSEAYFRNLVRASSDHVLVLDTDRVVTWAAPALDDPATAAGRPLVGHPVTDRVHPQDVDHVRAWLGDPARPGTGPSGLRSFRLPDGAGGWRTLEAGVTDLRSDDAVRALVLHCRDVTVRLHAEEELRSLAFTDAATGLPNRAALAIALTEELGLAGERAGVSLLLFEVEGLGEARENVGRDVVDESLVEVGRRLRATVRADDLVARVGPETFAVLAHGEDDEPDRVAGRCLTVVEQPVVTDLGLVDLSAAVGSIPLVAGLTAEVAVDRAELAVRAAHRAGPGSVRRYEAALGAARDRREKLREDLVGARARGELALAWQPIVAMADQRVTGVEALLRWRHPVYGELEPEEFVPIAERAGVIGDLQRWVLREATTAAVALPEHGAPLRLGINISAVHVASGTLVGDVSAALAASGLAPERLVVEITEATVLADAPNVQADFAALRLMGVHVALDDFGSGYSSLAHLTRLPVDIVKLDRTFLARIDKDAQTRALCASVIGIGGALGIDVVAEGVETSAQLTVLGVLGCTHAQGFLLSRPLPLPGLVARLDSGAGRLWPGRADRVVVAG